VFLPDVRKIAAQTCSGYEGEARHQTTVQAPQTRTNIDQKSEVHAWSPGELCHETATGHSGQPHDAGPGAANIGPAALVLFKNRMPGDARRYFLWGRVWWGPP